MSTARGDKDDEPNVYEVEKTLLPVSGGLHERPKCEKHGNDICTLAVGVSSLCFDKRPNLTSLLKIDHFFRRNHLLFF